MSAANSSNPVLCIPRVFLNITEQRIRRIFDDLNLGIIARVDIVPKTSESGENYNRVFVHFQQWNTTASAEEVRRRLQEGKEIKIIYDEPWFWKVSAYRPPATRPRQERPKDTRRPERPKATIELDSTPPSSSGWQLAKNQARVPVNRSLPRRCESGSAEWLGNDLPNMKNYHSCFPSKEAREAYLNEFLLERGNNKRSPPRPTSQRQTKAKESEVTRAIIEEARAIIEEGIVQI